MQNQQTNIAIPAAAARKTALVVGVPVAALAAGLLAMHSPALAVAGLGVAVVGGLVLVKPDLATVLVAFVLYTNAAVVAVKFHGVPMMIGASVPLLLGLPLCYYLVVRREKVILTRILPLLFLFEAIKLAGVLVAERPDESVAFMLGSATEGLVLYLLMTNVVRSQEAVRRVMWSIIAAGAFLGGLCLYQDVTKTYDRNYGGFAQIENNAAFRAEVDGREVLQPRLEGPIGEQNFFAQMLLLVWPLALFRIFYEDRLPLRIVAGLAFALIGAGVALTFSRGAALGAAAIVGAMCLMRYLRVWHLGVLVLGLTLVLIAVPSYRSRLQSFEKLYSALSGGGGVAAADPSTQGRLTEMLAAGLVFLDHPLLGVGPGMFKYHYPEYADKIGIRVQGTERAAHNAWLQIAAEGGAVAVLCFLVILGVTAWDLHRVVRTSRDRQRAGMAAALLLSLAGYAVTSQFLDYAYIVFFWMIMALAGAVTALPDRETLGEDADVSTRRGPEKE